MHDFILFILAIAVSFLLFKLYLVKQQLKSILKQLNESEETFLSVDFVDKDLEAIALQINQMLHSIQDIKVASLKGEKAIRSSISMISHDMRTPLTSVIGYLQLAERSCTDQEVLQDIQIALDRANYCNTLVNDFFELSIIDSSRYTPVMERINICEVVCSEILASYLSFEKSGITPVFEQADDTIWIWADAKLLVRVIQNLISNAIKYSTGEVHFSIVTDEKATLYISSSVSGFIDVEKIFDKFYRADNSRNSEGNGLGLYICRKFIEDMNGQITAYCDDTRLNIKIEFFFQDLSTCNSTSQ